MNQTRRTGVQVRAGGIWPFAVALGLAGIVAAPALADDAKRAGLKSVESTPTSIRITPAAPLAQAALYEVHPFETEETARTRPPAWTGTLTDKAIEVPGFDGSRDRMYSKWLLVDAATGQPVGPALATTVLADLGRRDNPLLLDAGLKGVQSIVDLDDAIALGVKQAAHNLLISQVVDTSGAPSEMTHEVDGQKISINAGFIRGLDGIVKKLTDAGANVTFIMLNAVPTSPQPGNPLIHPQTDLAGAPNHLGAFNLTDEQGYRFYRAAFEFLAERYSKPSRERGLVSGYIIGNEVQAHWWWYNIGAADAKDVISDYVRALRVADLAVRSRHRNLRVYASFDHHWTARMSEDRQRFIPGKELIDALAEESRRGGDFPWHVAFHPYPENLFEPRTWNDKDARLDFDTPKITFKNLEVLPAYLRQAHMRVDGTPRRIILSEQGFHAPDKPDGELWQAAAYAYAYSRASQTDGIDAFILHRHIDHAHEGGLRLGLRANQPGTVTSPGKPRKIHEVFRAAGTPEWETAFEFAKPVIGISDWQELRPKPVSGETNDPSGP